jgi:hypothetical protein
LKIVKKSRRERHSNSARSGQTKTKEVEKNNWGQKGLGKLSGNSFGQRPKKTKEVKKMSKNSRAKRLTMMDMELELIEVEVR